MPSDVESSEPTKGEIGLGGVLGIVLAGCSLLYLFGAAISLYQTGNSPGYGLLAFLGLIIANGLFAAGGSRD